MRLPIRRAIAGAMVVARRLGTVGPLVVVRPPDPSAATAFADGPVRETALIETALLKLEIHFNR